jgi:2'-hydroxyisoflavone reductase
MKYLILGGTAYLGRHAVDAARARGHEVTIFNRGRTNPDLFPDVERLRGDRDGDLAALAGRSWDAVLDPSGYLPRVVRASCDLLRDSVGHYCFISSINAYADSTKPGLVETDAPAELPADAPREEVTGDTYGPLKVLCEREVEAVFGGRGASVRAGLIYGPHDLTDRTRYWPGRVAEGGEVLAPGRPDRPIQLVDVRDLADWMVRLAERRIGGTFSATGPDYTLTMERYLATCREVAGSDARFTWVDERFLLERKVGPFSEVPVWVPEQFHAFMSVNCARAIAAGLTFRPLAETVRAALEWDRTLPPGPRHAAFGRISMPPVLSRAREAELLREWHARSAATT